MPDLYEYENPTAIIRDEAWRRKKMFYALLHFIETHPNRDAATTIYDFLAAQVEIDGAHEPAILKRITEIVISEAPHEAAKWLADVFVDAGGL